MAKIRDTILQIEPYVPGRSTKEIAEEYHLKESEIVKLGSNENPLGPSPKAVKAVKRETKNMHRYPESGLDDLKKAIADYSGTSPNQIIVGGDGADEIIDLLGKTFMETGTEFIVPIPSYMYYEYTLRPYGARPAYAKWDMEKNTVDTKSVIESINDKTRLIFLCTPNNPTGGLIPKDDIIKILESTSALVVVDEAYFEFARVSNIELLEDYENLLILRTFSKAMGLAGMRIGYGISNPRIIDYMHRVKPVFSLTRLSHVAALATLSDKDYIKRSVEFSIKSREYLYSRLLQMDKIRVLRSYANYLLVDIRETGMNAGKLTDELLKRGVIVRDCTSFKGLDEYWIRVSVGTMKENDKFIEALGDIIE
ncbi:histidinol-phosphate transaminase [Methanothermobacter tenebrarum]|uniref:Histidinol-phosphate aminotransferase n=1 Tax=Methanothermobacter tenebrarum TaxID=680118 RepID=A0A328PEB4_9EURY|nr:histidinol-phosphate transaminase [Methanothermobacter tenebrarum]MBC7117683.1 histidinol-phosphate transaminase [Methanobacteriaceae archaeon]NPV64131.1 histidinol-phosphate transaminase [Methanobacteriaceae archaeon]RAO79753.1 histidinol-phosphate transaminase [Methanothermobacter tenebrarum]